ncbi:unnamed protein product [Closterium sp. NIES-65]|nr:unnamed protein product [Closterium sp. NIES-65]
MGTRRASRLGEGTAEARVLIALRDSLEMVESGLERLMDQEQVLQQQLQLEQAQQQRETQEWGPRGRVKNSTSHSSREQRGGERGRALADARGRTAAELQMALRVVWSQGESHRGREEVVVRELLHFVASVAQILPGADNSVAEETPARHDDRQPSGPLEPPPVSTASRLVPLPLLPLQRLAHPFLNNSFRLVDALTGGMAQQVSSGFSGLLRNVCSKPNLFSKPLGQLGSLGGTVLGLGGAVGVTVGLALMAANAANGGVTNGVYQRVGVPLRVEAGKREWGRQVDAEEQKYWADEYSARVYAGTGHDSNEYSPGMEGHREWGGGEAEEKVSIPVEEGDERGGEEVMGYAEIVGGLVAPVVRGEGYGMHGVGYGKGYGERYGEGVSSPSTSSGNSFKGSSPVIATSSGSDAPVRVHEMVGDSPLHVVSEWEGIGGGGEEKEGALHVLRQWEGGQEDDWGGAQWDWLAEEDDEEGFVREEVEEWEGRSEGVSEGGGLMGAGWGWEEEEGDVRGGLHGDEDGTAVWQQGPIPGGSMGGSTQGSVSLLGVRQKEEVHGDDGGGDALGQQQRKWSHDHQASVGEAVSLERKEGRRSDLVGLSAEEERGHIEGRSIGGGVERRDVRYDGDRCEVLISLNGSTTVISSGLLKPFASHIKAVEDQLSSGSHLIKLDPRTRTHFLKLQRQKLRGGYVPPVEEEDGADVDELISWFTRTTVERAVSFISSPGLIEHAVAIERELLHLEESLTADPSASPAADFAQISLSHSTHSPTLLLSSLSLPLPFFLPHSRSSPSGSPPLSVSQNGLRTVAESNGNEEGGELIMRIRKAMHMRLGMLRREQNVAVARAAAGGFTRDILSSLLLFADCFDALRLKQACVQFSTLLLRRELQANPPPAAPPAVSAVWLPLAPDAATTADPADAAESGRDSPAADAAAAAAGPFAIGTPVGGAGHTGPYSFVPMYTSGSSGYTPGNPFPYGLVAVAPGATAAAGQFPAATDMAGFGRGGGNGGALGGGPPGAVRIGGKPVFGVHHHHYHRMGGGGRKNRAAARISPKLRSWGNSGGAGGAGAGNGERNGELADVSSARYYDSDSGLPGGRARGGGARGAASGGGGAGEDMGIMSEADSFISTVDVDAMNGADAEMLVLGVAGRPGSAGGGFAGSRGWSRVKGGGGGGGMGGMLRRSGSGSLFVRPSAVAEGSDEFDDADEEEDEEDDEGAGFPEGRRQQQRNKQRQQQQPQQPQQQQPQQQQLSQLVLDPELMRRIQEVQLMQPGNQQEAELQQQMLQDLLARQQQQLQMQMQQQERLLQQQQQIQQLQQASKQREEQEQREKEQQREKEEKEEEEQRALEKELAGKDWLADPTTLAFLKQPNTAPGATAGGPGAGGNDSVLFGIGSGSGSGGSGSGSGGSGSAGSDSGPFSDDFMLMSGVSSPSPDFLTGGGGAGAGAGGVSAFDRSRSLNQVPYNGGANLEAEMLGVVAGAGAGGDSSARDFLGEDALRGPVDESGPSNHEDLMAWEASLGEAMLVGGGPDGSSSSSSSLYGDDMELSLAAERAAGESAGRGVGRKVGPGGVGARGVGGAGRGQGVVGSGVAGRAGIGARGRSLSSSSAVVAGAGRGRGRATNPQDRVLMEMERKQQEAARRREEEKKRQQEARQQHLKRGATGLVRSTSTSGIERRRTTPATSATTGVTSGNRTATAGGAARGTLGSLAGSRSLSQQHTASSAMRLAAAGATAGGAAGGGSSVSGAARVAGRVAARPSSPDLCRAGQRKVLSSPGSGPRSSEQQQGQEKEREKPGKENKGKEASASPAAPLTMAAGGGVNVGGAAVYHHPPGMPHHSPYGSLPEAGGVAQGRRASMEGQEKLGMLNNGVHMTNAYGYTAHTAPHQSHPAAAPMLVHGGPGGASPAAVGFGEGLREARLKQEREYLDMLREREAAWVGSEQDGGEKKKSSGLRKLFGGFGK